MTHKYSYSPRYTNSWALVIGINDYAAAPRLTYATNDASVVAEVLQHRFHFAKDNITVLLERAATQKAIRSAFLDFARSGKVKDDDRVLVFFAGHGLTVTGRRGEVGFLVPADGVATDLESLIRWDELTRNADLIPAKHVFFLMDACYGGLALLRAPAFGSMRFLGDMVQRYARQVLTAGKADETVADGNGVRPGHSIFTAHLLNALEGAAATENGVITASGVMAYVYDRVARDQYSRQTPHYGFLDGDGDFVFDTALLDALSGVSDPADGPGHEDERVGSPDVLINVAPSMTTDNDTEPPVVEAMKTLLADASQRIRLDDFVSRHIKQFLEATDLRQFPSQGVTADKDEFEKRIHAYEEAVKKLQYIAILLAKWGDRDQLALLERILVRVAEADKGSAGTVLWLRLAWYPIAILIYSAGISALAHRRYDALRVALTAPIDVEGGRRDGRQPIVVAALSNLTDIHDAWKWLPGHERHYTPRSEYLFKTLQPTLEDMLFLGRRYEVLFDDVEILAALIYVDATGSDWGPPGRFGWKQRRGYGGAPFTQLVEEASKAGSKWGPVEAGLFDGSVERFAKSVEAMQALIGKLQWW